jgi:hypothetical protein
MSTAMAIAATDSTIAALAAANTTCGRGLESSARQMDRALQFARRGRIPTNS